MKIANFCLFSHQQYGGINHAILRENQQYSPEDIQFSNRTTQGNYTEEPRISHLHNSIEAHRISPINSKNVIPGHSNYSIILTGQLLKLISLNLSYLLVLFFIIKSKKTNNYLKIKISLPNTSVTKYMESSQ